MRSFIIRGLIPWMWFLSCADGELSGLKIGAIGGMILMLIFNRKSLHNGFLFDWAAVVFFVVMLLLGSLFSVIVKYDLLLTYLFLSIICLITVIIKKSFSFQYAKLQVDEIYYDSKLLISVNNRISLFWAASFFVSAAFVYMHYLGYGSRIAMTQTIPTSFIVIAIAYTIFFPDYYKSSTVKKGGVSGINSISDVMYLRLGQASLGYRMLGNGNLIILLNGLGMNMHHWDPDFLVKLSRKFQILIFDYPGIGHSANSSVAMDFETLSTILNRFIQKLKLKPFALIGYSIGGCIAQAFVVNYPDVIEKLVLISSVSDIQGEKLPFDISLKSLFPENAIQRIKEKVSDIFLSANEEGIVSESIIKKEHDAVNSWSKNNLNILDIPTLIFHGKLDCIAPFENAELLSNRIKKSKLISYEDAGHGIIYQYSFDCADNVEQFLLTKN